MFTGLPVTFSALIIPIVYLSLRFIDLSCENVILQVVYLLTAIGFILNIKFKKPGIIFSIIMLIVAIALICGFIFL
jgi:CDP-diacylglycerol--serine O-phosphatidyltransferase